MTLIIIKRSSVNATLLQPTALDVDDPSRLQRYVLDGGLVVVEIREYRVNGGNKAESVHGCFPLESVNQSFYLGSFILYTRRNGFTSVPLASQRTSASYALQGLQ